MTALVSAEFIAELDDAVQAGSAERRFQILRRLTGLFLANAQHLNPVQIGLFDDVFSRLIDAADTQTLARLSSALADLTSPPEDTVRRLAEHEDPAVAAPVLLKTESLRESELISIANSRSQRHLLAISARRVLPESLTDAILKRGDTNVCRAIARNFGAQLSERGFSTLVATANRDDDIADSLVLRSDLPISMLHELLAVTTSAVRSRLHNIAPMEIRETIKASIEVIAAEKCRKRPPPVDYTEAQSIVVELNKSGKLNDSTINHFAVHGKRTNLVSALSLLATVSVESIEALMAESDGYGLMVACRASRLDWQTALAVAGNRSNARRFNQRELEQIKDAYQALPLSVAQRLIRFESIRDFASAMRPHSAGSFPAKAGAR